MRKLKGWLIVGMVGMAAAGNLSGEEKKMTSDRKEEQNPAGELRAVFETSLGKIVCRLFEKETPVTVANFTGLAKGEKEWTDPKTGQKVKRPFYDGLTFHRVIPNFMVQGGCPIGNGTGGPGYRFQDEIVPGIVFDRPGLLAMANSGPGTNGSQFFITHVPTPWLNGRHTIFGEVISGQEIVTRMGAAEKGPNDKPVTPIILKKLVIERAGAAEPERPAPAKKK